VAVKLSSIRIPARDSATGRAIATYAQAIVGYAFLIVADPSFATLLNKFAPHAALVLPTVIAVVTLFNNLFRHDVANY
jgi:hypothetical protein